MRGIAIVVAGLLTFATAACDSDSDSTSATTRETTTTATATDSTTTSTPQKPAPVTTRWRPLDQSSALWMAALAALRSAPTPAAGLERMLPILRQSRELPSERVTGRTVDGQGDETVIWISWRGFGDDSVSGSDVTIRTTAAPDGLEILGAASRSICARGSGPDLLACV